MYFYLLVKESDVRWIIFLPEVESIMFKNLFIPRFLPANTVARPLQVCPAFFFYLNTCKYFLRYDWWMAVFHFEFHGLTYVFTRFELIPRMFTVFPKTILPVYRGRQKVDAQLKMVFALVKPIFGRYPFWASGLIKVCFPEANTI